MTSELIKLSGVIPPVVTPLTPAGKLDIEGLDRLLHHLIEGGVSGVFVLGSSGEGPWFTPEMQNQVVRETVRIVDHRVPVLAGALEPIAQRVIDMIEGHANAGADLTVVTSPYYFGANAKTQFQHFESIANQSPLPVMLYNIPGMTHNPIPVETVNQLAAHNNIRGIKDSAGNLDDFVNLLNIREQHSDFVVFQGAEKLAAESMIAGANGVVPGLGNLVPAFFAEIVRLARDGEDTQARNVQEKINRLWTLHNYDYWLVCLKYAASVLNFGSGRTIGHPSQLSDTDKASIRESISEIVDIETR